MGKSILLDNMSFFVNRILMNYIQWRDENSWDLSNLLEWEREDESMGHIFDDQREEEIFVDQCTFMVPKLDGFVDVN